MKKLFVIRYFALLLLCFKLTSCSYEKTQLDLESVLVPTWDFNIASEYQFNGDSVEVSSGAVKLKTLSLTQDRFVSSSSQDLILGDTLSVQIDKNSANKSLNQILPQHQDRQKLYWKFENSWVDSSTSAVLGTPLSNATFSSSEFTVGASAASFDGSLGRVNLSEQSPDLSSGEFSYLFWLRVNSDTDVFQGVIGGIVSDTRMPSVFVQSGRNLHLSLGLGVGLGHCALSTTDNIFSLNTWQHVGITFKQGVGVRVFVDGAFVYESTLCKDVALLSGQDFYINPDNRLDGALDELALYDVQLPDSDIKQVYEKQKTSITELSEFWTANWNSLIGYWKFDGSLIDFSGHKNHGRLNGGLSYLNSAKVGQQATGFDGVDSSIDFANIPEIEGVNEISISGWFFLENTNCNFDRIFDSQQGVSIWCSGLASGSQGRLQVKVENSVGTVVYVRTSELLPVNEWHFFTFTYNGTEAQLFLDGDLQEKQALPGPLLSNLGAIPYIGQQPTGATYLHGQLDDFAIWSKPLDQAQILSIYHRQKQAYAANYFSEVLPFSANGMDWLGLSWKTPFPLGKRIVGDIDNNGSPDMEQLTDYPLRENLSAGLVGVWPMNEKVQDSAPLGADLEDISGYGHHLTENGSGGNYAHPFLLGTGIHPNGNHDIYKATSTGSYYKASGGLLGTSPDWSFSFWIQPEEAPLSSFPNTSAVFTNMVSNSCRPCFYYDTYEFSGDAPVIAFRLNQGSGGFEHLGLTASKFKVDEWNHVVVTFNGSELKSYVNGVLDTNKVFSGVAPIWATTEFTVGAIATGGGGTLNDSARLNAGLSEMAAWSRALQASEVQQLYQRAANRIKVQVKTCVDSNCSCSSFNTSPQGNSSDCDGDGIPNASDVNDTFKSQFIGPGGDGTTYYSENFNRKPADLNFNCNLNITDSNSSICSSNEIALTGHSLSSGPHFLNANYTQFITPQSNNYLQYQVILEAENNQACSGAACLPIVNSLSLNPENSIKYYGGKQEVRPLNPLQFSNLLSVEIDADSCAEFQLSPSGNDLDYYYWTGVTWASATDPQLHVSPKQDLINHLGSYVSSFGASGQLYLKAYLSSDATQSEPCEIRGIDFRYTLDN